MMTQWNATATNGVTTLRYAVLALNMADALDAAQKMLSLDGTIPTGWRVVRVYDTGE